MIKQWIRRIWYNVICEYSPIWIMVASITIAIFWEKQAIWVLHYALQFETLAVGLVIFYLYLVVIMFIPPRKLNEHERKIEQYYWECLRARQRELMERDKDDRQSIH